MASPIRWQWDGEVMRPRPQYARLCDRLYTVGEIYLLDPIEEASASSRGHFFARVKEVWETLPEEQANRFPSPEHLRKWALVRAGWCNENYRNFANEADAKAAASMIRLAQEFAVITVRDCTVHTAVAKSQRQMKGDEFQSVKERVLQILDELLDGR